MRKETKSTKQVRELLKQVHEQALHRQEQNQTHMASMRTSETLNRLYTGRNATKHIWQACELLKHFNRLYTGNSRIEYIKEA